MVISVYSNSIANNLLIGWMGLSYELDGWGCDLFFRLGGLGPQPSCEESGLRMRRGSP